MDTLGARLKAARLKKKATPSEAAAATRIKIQHIEAMEQNAFDRIPAPTYVKGFLKLYAEYLGLPPAPIVKEYVDQHMPRERPSLLPDENGPRRPNQKPLITDMESKVQDPEPDGGEKRSFDVAGAIGSFFRPIRHALLKVPVKKVAIGVLAVVVVAGLATSLTRCASGIVEQVKSVESRPAKREVVAGGIAKEPSEPYLPAVQP